MTTQQRSISDVATIDLQTSGNVTISRGPAALSITAGSNQLPELTSEIENGTLILDATAALPSGDFSYALTLPGLSAISLDGSGSVSGEVDTPTELSITVSGSGSASLTGLDAPSLVVDVSGSGSVTLAGAATAQRVEISGSGRCDGAGLATQDTDVTVSGSGDASVQVSGQLRATISGSGNIEYSGSPSSVERNVSGSGEITGG